MILSELLQPFRSMLSKKQASLSYRSLEIGPGYIRAYSPFALLEAAIDLPGIRQSVHVDAGTFITIMSALADTPELKTTEKRLSFKHGSTSGYFNLLELDYFPDIRLPDVLTPCPWDLATALDLGAMSAAGTIEDMSSVTIVDDQVVSTNNSTISAAMFTGRLGSGLGGSNVPISIVGDAAALLRRLLDGPGTSTIAIIGRNLYYQDDVYRCHIKAAPTVGVDVNETLKKFTFEGKSVPVPEGFAAAFKQAIATAENRASTEVELRFTSNSIELSARSNSVTFTHSFLVDPPVDVMPTQITIQGPLLATALAHVVEFGLDYLDQRVLVLRDNKFHFLVSCR